MYSSHLYFLNIFLNMGHVFLNLFNILYSDRSFFIPYNFSINRKTDEKEMTIMKRRMKITALVLAAAMILSSISAFAGTGSGAEKNMLENGNYFITQGEKAVNLYANKLSDVKSYTKVTMWEITRDQTQMFGLTRQKDGSYKISLMKSGMTLNVKALKAGTEIIAYKDTAKNNEYYLIEETDRTGYYTIRLKNKPSLALTATGGKGLTLKKYAEGNAAQEFCFEKEETKTYNISLDVPKLSTGDKRWKDYYYDDGAKIGRYGCLLVSCTMAMSCMDQENYRPDQLAAKKFSFDNGGYMQWDEGWGKSRFKPHVTYSLATVRSELEKGKPVIIHGYSSSNGHHYAVITGVKGTGTKTSDYTVTDPSYSSVKTLADFLKKFPSKKQLVLVKK